MPISCAAPSELTRRLRQIGLVEEGQGQALQSALKVGQCLVSPKGALWRWDGYRASARRADGRSAASGPEETGWPSWKPRPKERAPGWPWRKPTLGKAEAATRQASEADRAAREDVRKAQGAPG